MWATLALTQTVVGKWAGVSLAPGSVANGDWSSTSKPSSLRLHLNPEEEGHDLAAWAKFTDTLDQNGWTQLSVHSNESFSDHDQAYAAGYLEGVLTQRRAWEFIMNMMGGTSYFHAEGQAYLHNNTKWVNSQVKEHTTSRYWRHVGLMYTQLYAAYDGYMAVAPKSEHVDFDAYYASTLWGDADDLCDVFKCDSHPYLQVSDGHCSVLIKPMPDNSDVFVGHTTWIPFESMTRVYKLYNLPYTLDGPGSKKIPGYRMTLPSYPGVMYSMDDYYQISTGMIVTETTIENHNPGLWKHVQPTTVLDWARNMVANRLASTGPEWVEVFSKYNSGTYNNQFMIFDYKMFTPGQPLRDGFFTIMEQMPGTIVTTDNTAWLRDHNYWASYNRVFFPHIWNISDQDGAVREGGDHFSWEKTSRAQIFREHHSTVNDHASFRKIMRRNKFDTDDAALATQACKTGISASNAIAERGDLTSKDADCIPYVAFQDEASTDMKYAGYKLMSERLPNGELALSTHTQSGPSYDDQPAFRWSTSPFKDISHIGLPDLWNFPWVDIKWDN